MDSFAIAPEILNRISPEPSSPLIKTCQDIISNPYLSRTLVNAISGLRDLMFFDDFNLRDKSGLAPEDHDLFRASSHIIEHELLDYPYRMSSVNEEDSFSKTNLHPIEAIVRIVSLCYINTCFIVSPPASGLGRSLARNIRNTLSNPALLPFYNETQCLDLLIWAYLLGAHMSRGQIDWPWMVHGLADILRRRGLRTWPEVVEIMRGYLYMPRIHEDSWVWACGEALAVADSMAKGNR